MRDFDITVEIEAPPERVWSVMSDVERWPEWTPTVTSVERLDAGPLAVGRRAHIRQPKLPPAVWRVVELEEGRGFTWVSVGPGVRVTARHTVERTERGSRATLSIRFSGPMGSVVGWMTRDLNARYLGLEAAGLKSRSESGA